ncbi:MAG: hypothetical protein HYW78_04735 [Parcubacteria group bacterium]|nr:hypothetical protein [Parcubacteria group bacterium]
MNILEEIARSEQEKIKAQELESQRKKITKIIFTHIKEKKFIEALDAIQESDKNNLVNNGNREFVHRLVDRILYLALKNNVENGKKIATKYHKIVQSIDFWYS